MNRQQEKLENYGIDDEIMLIDDDAYCESLIGVTSDSPTRAVYDFDKMIVEYAEHNHCTTEEAQEWIEYNVLRALPYFGDAAPIVIYPLTE